MAPLRIAHVITRLYRAGSEENTITTCLGQAEAGHEVVLVHGADHDPTWRAEIGDRIRLVEARHMVHPLAPLADLRAVRELTGVFRALRPDVVHTHQSKAGVLGRAAARLAGARLIVHGVHIVPFLNVGAGQRMVYLAGERLAARVTDAFIDVSGGMRDACLAAGVGRPDNHFVVYSGMDLSAFRAARAPQNWRELLGVAPDAPRPPVVVMLAALEPRKRHVELLAALGPVMRRFPDLRLVLGGEGPHRPAVEAMIAAQGLSDAVRLLGHYPRPAELIALADVCLLTSMREGLPRVVVQYVAAGKPAIVSAVPGIGEIITDGRNGLVADADDMADVAGKLADLLADRARLAMLTEGAGATDVSAWEKDALVSGVAAVYDHLLQGGDHAA